MKQKFSTLGVLVMSVALTAAVAFHAVAQEGQASGGKITTEASPAAKATSKSSRKSPPKVSARNSSKAITTNTNPTTRSSAAIETIDGKWWTTGNGFGDSEVIFTQNGSQVSGVIRYADGRTGMVTGTMVGKKLQHTWSNSGGEGGTGWLELSWNNFLGGPWHNQRVRDGSWTLNRIEGKWCFGGSRNRIRTVTHNTRGEVLVVTEDGSQDEGRLEGPLFFLDSDFGSIQGTMNFRKNRVDWSTGFFWTWCGR
jgi:hypothetical protein